MRRCGAASDLARGERAGRRTALRGPAGRRVREPVTWGRHLRQRPECLIGWGIERVVTTGSRRGSDDAIGAGVLPLEADSVAAGIALAGAIAIGRRDPASCMSHAACLAQNSAA